MVSCLVADYLTLLSAGTWQVQLWPKTVIVYIQDQHWKCECKSEPLDKTETAATGQVSHVICKVTHLCHIMILLQNIIFRYFVYLPIWIHTHATKPTFSFSISFLLDFNSCCIFVFVWSLMFSQLVCWTKWLNYWGEVSWSTAGWAAAWSPPDTWYFLVQPLACPISIPSDCG